MSLTVVRCSNCGEWVAATDAVTCPECDDDACTSCITSDGMCRGCRREMTRALMPSSWSPDMVNAMADMIDRG